MSMIIAAIVFVPLLAVAIACLTWSMGGSWPIRDRQLVARTVIGRTGVNAVPRLPAFVAAMAVLAAGVVALALADRTGGGPWLTALGVLLGLVFIARGVVGYTGRWRAAHPEEPFATLDRRNYSPLSLIIGVGYLLLVLMRLL